MSTDNGLQLIIEATKALAEKITKNPRGFKDQTTSLVQSNADTMELIARIEELESRKNIVRDTNIICTMAKLARIAKDAGRLPKGTIDYDVYLNDCEALIRALEIERRAHGMTAVGYAITHRVDEKTEELAERVMKCNREQARAELEASRLTSQSSR